MSKIMILGSQGSGKSTSIGNIPELNIKGLDPKETFIIACTNKGLPFKGWIKSYPRVKVKVKVGTSIITEISPTGNYYQTTDAMNVARLISLVNVTRKEIKNIVIDDSNYLMQDYYMANALKGGYDVFKKIGLFMGSVFNAIENVDIEKNVIMMAHYEEFKSKNSDTLSFRYKTVGKMVQDYITPEGKFEIVLFATQEYDDQAKTVSKFFVTNYDGDFPSKSPVGMFDATHIPNDLGFVVKRIHEYNTGSTE